MKEALSSCEGEAVLGFGDVFHIYLILNVQSFKRMAEMKKEECLVTRGLFYSGLMKRINQTMGRKEGDFVTVPRVSA